MNSIYTIILLTISNTFMTFAWYGHLKFKEIDGFQKPRSICGNFKSAGELRFLNIVFKFRQIESVEWKTADLLALLN